MTFDPVASLLHRDAMLLIINKPAGLPVHAGPGGGDHLGHHLDALRFGLPRLPQLAHRLDRDTSGCLALGRHAEALRRLGKLFEQSRVEKTYWAIVAGAPPHAEGRIDQPLLRALRPGGYGFRMLPDPTGQEAITDYKVLGQHNGQSWLELRPRTGRTHQLRAHCTHLGCPIIGDDKYGTPAPGTPLHLHAHSLSIPLNPKKPPVAATAPPPPYFAPWLALLAPTPPPIIP
ncbi:MAG: RNA pseudouridine synthase [Alphaproteobacteria bacterium]